MTDYLYDDPALVADAEAEIERLRERAEKAERERDEALAKISRAEDRLVAASMTANLETATRLVAASMTANDEIAEVERERDEALALLGKVRDAMDKYRGADSGKPHSTLLKLATILQEPHTP